MMSPCCHLPLPKGNCPCAVCEHQAWGCCLSAWTDTCLLHLGRGPASTHTGPRPRAVARTPRACFLLQRTSGEVINPGLLRRADTESQVVTCCPSLAYALASCQKEILQIAAECLVSRAPVTPDVGPTCEDPGQGSRYPPPLPGWLFSPVDTRSPGPCVSLTHTGCSCPSFAQSPSYHILARSDPPIPPFCFTNFVLPFVCCPVGVCVDPSNPFSVGQAMKGS